MQNIIKGAAVAAVLGAIAAHASAIIPVGLYNLENHPDGGAADPTYGFRLDELMDVNPGSKDIFTFDFNHPDSQVRLNYTGSSIQISGPAFGGLDVGSEYSADPMLTGVYMIDFTYSVGVGTAPGDDDLIVIADMGANSGSITTPGGDVIGLWDKPRNGFNFRLGNEDNEMGHRGFDGISGWGWVNHTDPNVHVKSSDWIFTLNPTAVPAPASAMLAGLGLATLAPRRRRA